MWKVRKKILRDDRFLGWAERMGKAVEEQVAGKNQEFCFGHVESEVPIRDPREYATETVGKHKSGLQDAQPIDGVQSHGTG